MGAARRLHRSRIGHFPHRTRPSVADVPPAGFEPAHPAPEAGALSPELRGREPRAKCSGPIPACRSPGTRTAPRYHRRVPPMTVLVVDDDPVIVRLLEVKFRLEGFNVVAPSDGEEGSRRQGRRPDCDLPGKIIMPVLNGLSWCARLHPDPQTRRRARVLPHRRGVRTRTCSPGYAPGPATTSPSRSTPSSSSTMSCDLRRAATPLIGPSSVRVSSTDAAARGPPRGHRRERDLPTPECRRPSRKSTVTSRSHVALALAKQAGRPPRDLAQAIAGARSPPAAAGRRGRGGRARVLEHPHHDYVAVRRAARAIADLGEAQFYGSRGHPRGAQGPGGVRERQPDRAAPCRPCPQRRRAMRSPVCSKLPAIRSNASTTSTTRGGQMDRFGASVEARHLPALGRDAEVPEDGYHGEYIGGYAEDIVPEHGDDPRRPTRRRASRRARARAPGEHAGIRATLARFRVAFDSYVSEASLERRVRSPRRSSGCARPS